MLELWLPVNWLQTTILNIAFNLCLNISAFFLTRTHRWKLTLDLSVVCGYEIFLSDFLSCCRFMLAVRQKTPTVRKTSSSVAQPIDKAEPLLIDVNLSRISATVFIRNRILLVFGKRANDSNLRCLRCISFKHHFILKWLLNDEA